MAQLLPLKGSVLRIFIKVFVRLSYLYSGEKKKSSSHWYRIEGFRFFVYYRCAQHRNLPQPGDVCHWLFFPSVCGLSPSKSKPRSNSACERKRCAQLLLHTCTVPVLPCWVLVPHTEEPVACVGSCPGVPCSARAAAAEDLTCSLSGVLLCSSDNSIMKGPNLFLLCTLCSSVLPPLLFPESLI